ncbi:hypothetical protein FGO68_gene2912 [Halteria grandinella]|uniref:Uncharacterized protein n=1 Tax=Halteria grandinella TaxID=5974 RepID=A0A8J8T4Z6_HALGN|nr:hypothetical protein FGO68_gene2912 [Halteria grandinella]
MDHTSALCHLHHHPYQSPPLHSKPTLHFPRHRHTIYVSSFQALALTQFHHLHYLVLSLIFPLQAKMTSQGVFLVS